MSQNQEGKLEQGRRGKKMSKLCLRQLLGKANFLPLFSVPEKGSKVILFSLFPQLNLQGSSIQTDHMDIKLITREESS